DQSEAFHIPDRLASLRERELIYRRERSMFAGAEEYLFKHSLLQEATYQTVLLKQRRILHGQIGAWIEANAGERLEEYLVIVAGHYAAADQPKRAADWYVLAGERAARQGATPEATDLFTYALELYPKNELAGRWRALAGRDGAYGTMGEREAREADDTALLALAEEMNDDHFLSEAYFRLGFHQYTLGNNERSIEYYDRGLECARRIDDTIQEAVILPVKLISLTRLGDLKMAETLVEPTLRLAFSTTNLEIQTRALNNVAYYYSVIGDIARAAQLVQQGVELNQEQGNLFGEVVGLANLGYNYLLLGRYEEGRQVLEKTVKGSRKISAQQFLAYSLLNLAMAHWRLGNLEAAEQNIQDSAASLQSMGDEMGLAFNRFYHALIRESAHDYVAAATCYETAQNDFERLHNLPQKYEAIAGLARLEKEDGDQQEARDLALQIFEYLTKNGPQGMELPFLVYLTCVEIFYSDEDLERLAYIMEKGQDELRTRAGQISDITWRQTFMDVVPEHRLLLQFKPDHKIDG
ncbi:MAG: Adenylate cyclase, partial [Chloroflexi bacterium]|nr:Adenylate cyclase [Chloroflexota bacterium]